MTAVQLLKQRNPSVELDIIERQGAHLVRLVNDLFDVSKIVHGKIELKRRPLDLASVVGAAAEQARPLMTQRGHALIVGRNRNVPSTAVPVDDRLQCACAGDACPPAWYPRRCM